MYFRPALRAFSESSSPLNHPSSAVHCSHKFLRNRHRLVIPVVPGRRQHFCNCRTETRDLSRSISIRSIESGRPGRNSLVSSFVLSSLGWMMTSLSSSSPTYEGSGSVAITPSAVNPVLAEEPDSTVVESSPEDVIVQYIVIRKDLVVGLNWPLGSVISQGCHAAVAAIWLHKDDPVTRQYCAPENLDNMHKVTLEVKGEAQLWTLAQKLESGGIVHKLWVEQPENYTTCLATKPYFKSQVSSYFKKLKLCK